MSNAVTSCVLVGVDPLPVRIEASLSGGRGQFIIVGLPDASIRESRERVRGAMKASGFTFPTGRVVVSLSPADLPKRGSMHDLGIALALIAATTKLGPGIADYVAMGELGLDGSLRPTRGSVVAGSVAERMGRTAIVPVGASLSCPITARVVGASSLRQVVAIVRGDDAGELVEFRPPTAGPGTDLCDVYGQHHARRALEIAAAGGHHLLLIGPPGAGKSMLASRMPSILPPLDAEGMREVALVAEASDLPRAQGHPPFRAPHHSISMPALVGGGSGIPTAGEITKAHRGVLFLDELGEFTPSVLDALRQPMEAGEVLVSRQAASVRFPAAIQVVAATNPCPCGYLRDLKTGCTCPAHRKDRYRARLSGPLLDRFDLRVNVDAVRPDDLGGPPPEASTVVRNRVLAARDRQGGRGCLNRDLSARTMARYEDVDGLRGMLRSESALEAITARGWDRLRRVARTIADLAGDELVRPVHMKEAIDLRSTW
ncbi:MAG: YifB family Mg chelatase-like AAA ATPase [Acidimicrobiia bacterium]|nr:YifB family Mg chelatase-like AAA ATPase [Acidimicrobiia bacterium]